MHKARARLGLVVSLWAFGHVSLAQAKDFTFDVGNTQLSAGTGERLIDTFYPALKGRGLGDDIERQMQPYVSDLAGQLKDELETRLNRLDFGPFTQRTANAHAAAARMLTVDHASFIKIFSLTAAGGAAINHTAGFSDLTHPSRLSDKIQNGEAPMFGVAPGVGASLGFNFGALNLRRLGVFDPSRLQVYVSAMVLKFSYDGDDVRANAKNFGGHLKYQVFAPGNLTANSLVRWGGLNVALGLHYAGTDLNFKTTLPSGDLEQDVPIDVAGTTQTLRLKGVWTGDVAMNARLRAYTVPIEVSSYLQLLYAFTLFGGIAMDINTGHVQLGADARAPLTIAASGNNSPQSVTVLTPQPSLTYLVKRTPSRIDGRAFLGLQLNAGVIALYGQGMVDTNKTYLASVGLRGFY